MFISLLNTPLSIIGSLFCKSFPPLAGFPSANYLLPLALLFASPSCLYSGFSSANNLHQFIDHASFKDWLSFLQVFRIPAFFQDFFQLIISYNWLSFVSLSVDLFEFLFLTEV